jgi:hypothetical protein
LLDPPAYSTSKDGSESGSTSIVTAYTYSEPGYFSGVQCIYNHSSNLNFTNLALIQGTDGNSPFTGSVMALQAVGSLPTGEWTGFTTMSIVDNETAFALAAQANDTHYMYGLIGGRFYTILDHIQCSVSFTPQLFNVNVDVLSQNIAVIPTPYASIDIDPSRGLVNNTFYSLNFLSQILTTMYTGVLADAFTLNIEAVQARNNHSNINATESDILTGVTEGLELLLDFYFGSIGASQLMLFNSSTPVRATISYTAVRLVEPVYAYASFGINIIIVLWFAFEAARTRFWKDLPLFNSLDLKSVIVGFAAGQSEQLNSVKNWTGDAGDRAVGRLKVVLGPDERVLSLGGGVEESSSEAYLLS